MLNRCVAANFFNANFSVGPCKLLISGCVAVIFLISCAPGFSAAARPNVLFIAVDDLNHWVGHLGRNPQVKTPNIDRLAKMGVTFTRAYCAAPICNPSRTALLSGLRPSTTGVYNNGQDYRPAVAPELTLNSWFRTNGYFVAGAGKIYHNKGGRLWEWNAYLRDEGGESTAKLERRGVGGIQFGVLDCGDEEMPDYKIASWVIDQLRREHDKPFFLACGFHKPHMPWNIPKKYYDLYPLESIQLPPHLTNDLDDVPPAGVRTAHAFGDHEKVTGAGKWKEAIQGYLAAISFLDVQVGRLLDALEKSPYATNTVICFFGDHGWHLGEKEHWRKFALWEEATRAPFIWVAPGVTKPGGRCDRTVDFMSIYPTLCDLTGLATPKHNEGMSIKKLLVDPKAEWKLPALTTHGFQNHAVRTEQWRYIRYANGDEELYDHDQDEFEFANLALKSAEFVPVKAELAKTFPKLNKPGLPRGRQTEEAQGDEADPTVPRRVLSPKDQPK
jgi:arylsulfatase A-like enzyme